MDVIQGDTNKLRSFSPLKPCGVFFSLQIPCFFLSNFFLFWGVWINVISKPKPKPSKKCHLKWQILSTFCHLLSRILPLIFRLWLLASYFLTLSFVIHMIKFYLWENYFHLPLRNWYRYTCVLCVSIKVLDFF